MVWDSWENTSDSSVVPADLHFDAARYEAELARAAADRSWEEPVDTAARLLGRTLAESRWFERWGCVLTEVSPRREDPGLPEELREPEGVDVGFHRAGETGERMDAYRYTLFVDRDRPVAEQVRRMADLVLAEDPRRTAERER
ncbi:hypothetical protein [Nocardiopsis sp. NPDC055824]